MEGKNFWVFLDVETPCVKNNNAQESIVYWAGQCGLGEEVGAKFFQRIDLIDNLWGSGHKKIKQDPFYRPGGTLKIMPIFLKAMGATSKGLYDFARQSIRLTPNIKGVLKSLDDSFNVRLLSTAYCFSIKAFCNLVGFSLEKVYCTRVDEFDKALITKEQAEILKSFMKEVATWPVIRYSEKTGKIIPGHRDYYCLLYTSDAADE